MSESTQNVRLVCDCEPLDIPEEITDRDLETFFKVVSVELDPDQVQRVVEPARTYPRQHVVMACHWHPEFVPMEHIRTRVETMFPHKEDELIIPTQHNQILEWDGYAGVEVDCYASGFNQKVQLLLHFEAERVRDAAVLKAMLEHTFKYRSSQLFEFMHTITRPVEDRLQEAARETAADDQLVAFVTSYVKKIEHMLDENHARVPEVSIKNKLLRNFFEELRPQYGDTLINRAQAFLKAVKVTVKRHFSLRHFYRASEIIEETRALGGCVIIPHPEQFWPILLAGYDVDGYEVWNPQSRRYTDFLISVMNEKNSRQTGGERPLLVFMGDDCHMGEKVKDPTMQNAAKAAREIGVQPAWDDLSIRKKLVVAGMNRRKVMEEYKSRLAS